MDWVLDSSLALAWVLPDVTSSRADRFLARLRRDTALWVPALWWYEVTNALLVAGRRRRLEEPDRHRALESLGQLPLRTDLEVGPELSESLDTIAHAHGLSAYDAAYVELARRQGVGLATLDESLAAAARRCRLRVWR